MFLKTLFAVLFFSVVGQASLCMAGASCASLYQLPLKERKVIYQSRLELYVGLYFSLMPAIENFRGHDGGGPGALAKATANAIVTGEFDRSKILAETKEKVSFYDDQYLFWTTRLQKVGFTDFSVENLNQAKSYLASKKLPLGYALANNESTNFIKGTSLSTEISQFIYSAIYSGLVSADSAGIQKAINTFIEVDSALGLDTKYWSCNECGIIFQTTSKSLRSQLATSVMTLGRTATSVVEEYRLNFESLTAFLRSDVEIQTYTRRASVTGLIQASYASKDKANALGLAIKTAKEVQIALRPSQENLWQTGSYLTIDFAVPLMLRYGIPAQDAIVQTEIAGNVGFNLHRFQYWKQHHPMGATVLSQEAYRVMNESK